MFVTDVHHVSINVDDLEAAEHFYIDILGLERLPRPDLGIGGTWLAAGDRQIHLIALDAVAPDMGQHFALRVNDLDGVIALVQEHGYETSEIMTTPVGRQASLSDPCGNRVEFNQPS